jgi:hypothetical protein
MRGNADWHFRELDIGNPPNNSMSIQQQRENGTSIPFLQGSFHRKINL